MARVTLLLVLIVALLSGTLGGQSVAPILVPGHYVAGSSTQPAEVRTALSGALYWYILGELAFTFGLATDLVVIPARDYDGDGYDDPAVYRPSTQTWYVLNSACATGARWTCSTALTVP